MTTEDSFQKLISELSQKFNIVISPNDPILIAYRVNQFMLEQSKKTFAENTEELLSDFRSEIVEVSVNQLNDIEKKSNIAFSNNVEKASAIFHKVINDKIKNELEKIITLHAQESEKNIQSLENSLSSTKKALIFFNIILTVVLIGLIFLFIK